MSRNKGFAWFGLEGSLGCHDRRTAELRELVHEIATDKHNLNYYILYKSLFNEILLDLKLTFLL